MEAGRQNEGCIAIHIGKCIVSSCDRHVTFDSASATLDLARLTTAKRRITAHRVANSANTLLKNTCLRNERTVATEPPAEAGW